MHARPGGPRTGGLRRPGAPRAYDRRVTAFRIDRAVPLSADEAWRRLTDWPAHADQVPLTRISVLTPGPTRTGTVFVARTALGRRAGFDDPMEVVVWEPPTPGGAGRCRLEKRGRVVTGWAEIQVREEGGVTWARWVEELRFGPLPASLDPLAGPLTARAGRAVFGRAVDRLLRGRPDARNQGRRGKDVGRRDKPSPGQ